MLRLFPHLSSEVSVGRRGDVISFQRSWLLLLEKWALCGPWDLRFGLCRCSVVKGSYTYTSVKGRRGGPEWGHVLREALSHHSVQSHRSSPLTAISYHSAPVYVTCHSEVLRFICLLADGLTFPRMFVLHQGRLALV